MYMIDPIEVNHAKLRVRVWVVLVPPFVYRGLIDRLAVFVTCPPDYHMATPLIPCGVDVGLVLCADVGRIQSSAIFLKQLQLGHFHVFGQKDCPTITVTPI